MAGLAGDSAEPDARSDDPDARVLLASLGAGWVAVAAEDVEAVVRPAPVTPVGGTPRWVAGLAAVRGVVRPVVDARRLAGAGPTDEGADAWWIVVGRGARSAAVAGLRVWRVAPLAADAADAADAAGGGGPEPAPPVPGLPAGGVARLAGDPGRGADALPPAARLLDVAALLDLVHDPTHAP